MKKRFLLVFALLSVLTLVGCDDEKRKQGTLSAPQEITVQTDGSRSLIIFDEVDNAEYYHIYINDVAITIRGNGSGTIQYDASRILTSPQKYTIRVKAGSDNYFSSDFSKDYEYNHTSVLEAPAISIDGTTLNWQKIENAEFYDVVVTTFNPTVESVHRFSVNKFDFSNLLVGKGEYLFKVKAVSENGEYMDSIYSNQVKYIHKLTLETPSNLRVSYDSVSGDALLSFISSPQVTDFILNIDGANYVIDESNINSFKVQSNYINLYTFKLSSFIRYKNIDITSTRISTVSVKAVANNKYLQSSEFSDTVICKHTTILKTPSFTLTKGGQTCKITITTTESEYLSGYRIYFNDQIFRTVTKNINEIELPVADVGDFGVRVQAISNNVNCHSSKISDAKYVNSSMSALANSSIQYENKVVKWNAIANATKYYIEITNAYFKHSEFIGENTFDLSNVCEPGSYLVRVIAFAEGYKQGEAQKQIQHVERLAKVEDCSINSIADSPHLYFTEVEDAYGYVLYLNGTRENRIFIGSPINLNSYISDASGYTINVQAVDIVNDLCNSELSDSQALQNVKTLTSPTLSISKEGDRYYLNIDVIEQEASSSSGCEIWINYVSLGVKNHEDSKIDITSYFSMAGNYSFMAKVLANQNNQYVKDSNISGLTYTCTKQLDTVTDISVTELEEESRYVLTFKEQTMAAKYLVTIVKADDENYSAEFEVNAGFADITEYVVEKGVYKVYVKALALKDSFYTDSASSGNPYRFTKGLTLPVATNISINKQEDGSVILSWDKVENCSGYLVNVYYDNAGRKILKQSIETQDFQVNIGDGAYKCLNKEGVYVVQVKVLGDNQNYETSQIATYSYSYAMETIRDFKRNEVYMYGQYHDYYIDNLDDLKYLLWYHYLYNDTWTHNSLLQYNLKVYCKEGLDLNELAKGCGDVVYAEVLALSNNVDKMNKIASTLLSQYPEIAAYTLGCQRDDGSTQKFCLNETKNVYIFRYQDVLDKDKLVGNGQTFTQLHNKLNMVDVFERRSDNYVFAIDSLDSMDVTTTEQLFMAVQYGKRPNFVGDCLVAQTVYENARFVLRQLCSDGMSEYQKTLQLYEFLTNKIAYNTSISMGNANDTVGIGNGQYSKRGNIKDFHLEGVLYNFNADNGLFTNIDQFNSQTAASEGLAKAYVLLCAIEGIDCVKVDGTASGVAHSWNKVYIDIENTGKEWYVVDTASCRTAITYKNGTVYNTALHNYFLITDIAFESMTGAQATLVHEKFGKQDEEGNTIDYVANNDKYQSFGYYSYQKYSSIYKGADEKPLIQNKNLTAANANDMISLMMCGMEMTNRVYRMAIEVDASAYLSVSNNTADLKDKIVGEFYISARQNLEGKYTCAVNVLIQDSIVMIVFDPV